MVLRQFVIYLISLCLTATAFGAPFNVDTGASVVKWIGTKVSGAHNGTVKLKSGSFELSEKVAKGKFTIDMATISNGDMSGKWKTKLEDHLKSDDFFNIAKFPQAVFVLKGGKLLTKQKYQLTGDLTVKGKTHSITFPADVSIQGGTRTLKAKFKINRLKWGIKYNSGKFFDVNKLGDRMIYDDIDIELDLIAKR